MEVKVDWDSGRFFDAPPLRSGYFLLATILFIFLEGSDVGALIVLRHLISFEVAFACIALGLFAAVAMALLYRTHEQISVLNIKQFDNTTLRVILKTAASALQTATFFTLFLVMLVLFLILRFKVFAF
jgi:hypothetical protein